MTASDLFDVPADHVLPIEDQFDGISSSAARRAADFFSRIPDDVLSAFTLFNEPWDMRVLKI